MIDVTYIGPHAAVEIEPRPGVFQTVAKGETVQVPDKLAKGDDNASGLLAQEDNWAEPKPAAKPKS